MKRLLRPAAVLLALMSVAMIARDANAPIALDWHGGSRLCVLYNSGVTALIDERSGRQVQTIPPSTGWQPVEIVAAALRGVEYVFVSGFLGRTATVLQFTTDGRRVASFQMPEQAASMDIDPGTTSSRRRIMYVASAITNNIYTLDLDQKNPKITRHSVIYDAKSIGPVLFDQARGRLLAADTGSGALYEIDANGNYRLIATDLGRPIALAFDTTFNNLYVGDHINGRVQIFKRATQGFNRVDVITTRLSSLSAIATGPANTLYVGDRKKGLFRLVIATKLLEPLPVFQSSPSLRK